MLRAVGSRFGEFQVCGKTASKEWSCSISHPKPETPNPKILPTFEAWAPVVESPCSHLWPGFEVVLTHTVLSNYNKQSIVLVIGPSGCGIKKALI